MKKFFCVFVYFLLFTSSVCSAQVVVNEIMYNSPGADNDWVEIYNSGSSAVTIVTGSAGGSWRFVDSGSHTLTLVDGTATLAVGDYAIITNDPDKFKSEFSSFSGNIFKSSFSLTNTSNSVSLKDGSGNLTSPAVSYASTDGASGDGNSLQRQSGDTWLPALPTPGLTNSNTAYVPPDNSGNVDSNTNGTTTSTSSEQVTQTVYSGGGGSTHTSQVSISNTEIKLPTVSAGRHRYIPVGTPVNFEAWSKDTDGVIGNFTWSFGDGASSLGQKTSHAYLFPGTYNVVLNANFNGKEAVSRTKVIVFIPDMTISNLDTNLGYLELKNNSESETNLFGWNLKCDDTSFAFPQDTIVDAKSNLKLPLSSLKCLATTTNWSLTDLSGKFLSRYQQPEIFADNAERQKLISEISQKLNLVSLELSKMNHLVQLSPVTKDIASKNEVINKVEKIEAPKISAETQVGGVIVLDKEPLSDKKSIFSWVRSLFGK